MMSDGKRGEFGEPWDHHSMEEAVFVDADRKPFMDAHEFEKPISYEKKDRIIECVNAFAVIDDPAEELARLRRVEAELSEARRAIRAMMRSNDLQDNPRVVSSWGPRNQIAIRAALEGGE